MSWFLMRPAEGMEPVRAGAHPHARYTWKVVGSLSVIASIAAFLLGSSGCTGHGTSAADPCLLVECSDGQQCVDGVCIASSTGEVCGTSTCAAGEQCVDGACITNSTPIPCFADGDCAASESCSNGICTAGPASDLAQENPTVDFAALSVGISYALVAPDPQQTNATTVGASGKAFDKPVAFARLDASESRQRPAPAECTCNWSTTPAPAATFGPINACATEMTPQEVGTPTISVVVDCGNGPSTFAQSTTVSAAPPSCTVNEDCARAEVCVESRCAPRTGPLLTLLGERSRPPFAVTFDVRIEDATGDPITENVGRSQFRIFEDGQEIDYVETGFFVAPAPNLPLKIILVLDYTVSMQIAQAIGDMVAAARQFVQAEHFTATHQIGVVEFHDRTAEGLGFSEVAALTSMDAEGKSAVTNAIPAEGSLEPGLSRVWDAVTLAIRLLGETPRQPGELQAIVFLTDGRDTTSEVLPGAVLASAKTNKISMYPIGFGQVGSEESLLRSFAEETAGAYFPAGSASDLSTVFLDIANDLRGQWTVRYISQRNTGTVKVGVEFNQNQQTDSFEQDVNVAGLAGDIHAAAVEVLDRRYAAATDITTFRLKAAYIPRNVSRFRFFIPAADATLALQGEGGLTPPSGGWVLLSADGMHDLVGGTALELGAFGNIGVVSVPGDVAQLAITHDDSVFETLAQPKRVVFEGDDYTPPGMLTVLVDPPEAGVVDVSPLKLAYAEGESVSLAASAFGDHVFDSWAGGATGSAFSTTLVMNGDQTATAKFFPPRKLTLTITPSTAGTIAKNPDKASYRHGEVVVLTATTIASTFSAWSGDATGTTTAVTVTMTGDKSVTATFTVTP